MLHTGLNPYGLTFVLGLQGQGTPRANPSGRGLDGFLAIATELGARTIELHNAWLGGMDDAALRALRARLAALSLTPIISAGALDDTSETAIRSAQALGATTIRQALTRVLCGDRSALGARWETLVATVRAALRALTARAAQAGLVVAIENHQDFGSRELVAFCEDAGDNVGICFDTGNAFPVGEAPLDFARRVAPRVRHLHLKDYRAQWTDEGFRLVRCAIGDGAVPLAEIAAILREHHPHLTASLEPGALESRHIRLFTPEWWNGYPPTTAPDLARCLSAARRNRLPDNADVRTPWERGEPGESVIEYELAMIRRSAANMRALGLMN